MTDALATDSLVARLRVIGCVFAEDEATEIRRVLSDPVSIDAVVAARGAGVPLEQALGRARFAGIEVRLADGVFVPRLRAEAIVDAAAAAAPDARIVADLGTGAGAIAAALATRLPRAEVHATEIDPVAAAVAAGNGAVFGFATHLGDWWTALPVSLRGRIGLAAAYLPHVPTRELAYIPGDFRAHEPDTTVHGGADGLDPLRAVLAGMDEWLRPGGAFVTLVAEEQVETARRLLRARSLTEIATRDGDLFLVIRR